MLLLLGVLHQGWQLPLCIAARRQLLVLSTSLEPLPAPVAKPGVRWHRGAAGRSLLWHTAATSGAHGAELRGVVAKPKCAPRAPPAAPGGRRRGRAGAGGRQSEPLPCVLSPRSRSPFVPDIWLLFATGPIPTPSPGSPSRERPPATRPLGTRPFLHFLEKEEPWKNVFFLLVSHLQPSGSRSTGLWGAPRALH